MAAIIIYTDGGCRGNPGPGGWAYIIKSGNSEISESGCDRDTTNNRMELTAVIKSLERVINNNNLSGKSIELHTDSKYVKNGITNWINSWVRNGWKTAARKPVKNRELWISLKDVSDKLDVTWKWVKGHAGDPMNEACDTMVNREMDNL